MKYRALGQTGLKLSEIGHGTWGIGGLWGPTRDHESIAALLAGFEQGINFVDTAPVYGEGRSENLIAAALRQWRSTPIYIATKVPPQNKIWPADPAHCATEVYPASHLVQSIEQSLKNLRRETLDLLQLHVWVDSWLDRLEWLEPVLKLKQEGKIRFFGISVNEHAPQTALKIVQSGVVDTIQILYNLFDRSAEQELFPLCIEKKVGVIVRSPFDEGSLTGRLKQDQKFHIKDWRRFYFTPERLIETCYRIEKLSLALDLEKRSLAQIALKFCLSHPAVSCVIPGMRNAKHVQENCEVSEQIAFNQTELEHLKKQEWRRNFYPIHSSKRSVP